MNLSVKKFNKQIDYELIKIWFAEWEWSAPELDQIPEESWMAYVNEIPVAFSCFGKTDSSIAIMGFTIARKQKIEGQSQALDFLVEHIFSRVKDCGFKYLHYYTDSLSMVNRMEKLGMEVTDRGTAYILLKNISGNNHKFYDE